MSVPSASLRTLRQALTHPTRGVTGMVDDLLAACREHSLQLEWGAGRCYVRPIGGDSKELIEVPLRKSVFRALLARVAAVCNERSPNAVSPYGGSAEIAVGQGPATSLKVAFANTPSELRLEFTASSAVATEDVVRGDGDLAGAVGSLSADALKLLDMLEAQWPVEAVLEYFAQRAPLAQGRSLTAADRSLLSELRALLESHSSALLRNNKS